jgi:hypothetical protein
MDHCRNIRLKNEAIVRERKVVHSSFQRVIGRNLAGDLPRIQEMMIGGRPEDENSRVRQAELEWRGWIKGGRAEPVANKRNPEEEPQKIETAPRTQKVRYPIGISSFSRFVKYIVRLTILL